MRQVRRLQGEGAFQIVLGLRQRLLGQRVHQVDVEVVVAGVLRQLDRALGFGAVMDAPQALQGGVVETLHAEAQPVDPGRTVPVETPVLGGPGIGFQGDFQIGRKAQARGGGLQEAIDRFGRKQAGRAAAKEHRVHHAAPHQRQVRIQVADQRIHVVVERQRALGRMRIEIAVRAFAHAPGQVHVQRERRRDQVGHSGVLWIKVTGRAACAAAWPALLRGGSGGSSARCPSRRRSGRAPGPGTPGCSRSRRCRAVRW